MKNFIAVLGTGLAVAASADPVVSDVTLTQSGDTVTIGYALSGDPAIITVDIQTNSVSIGAQHLTYFTGDVNKQVAVGTHTMTWKPRKAWPNNAVTENVKAVVSAWSVSAPPDYLVASLTVANEVYYYANKDSIPFGVTNDMYKTDYLVMRKIPAANVQWRMGQPEYKDTVRLVTLSKDFYMGVYQVTQRQYELLMGIKPATQFYYTNELVYATRPAERVSYVNIRGRVDGYSWPANGHSVSTGNSFLGKLRAMTGLSGIDLPLETQWEFACRAGSGLNRYTYPNSTADVPVELIGRYRFNGGQVLGDDGKTYVNPDRNCTLENGTAAVGSYEPNAWGLYDMLGNVREWCLDWEPDTSTAAAEWTAEIGAPTGTNRVYRSGGYVHSDFNIRCGDRGSKAPNTSDHFVGFRVAMELP